MPRVDPKLRRFYDQKLHWSRCQGGLCAGLTVPMSYAHPSGKTVDVRLLKVPAGHHPAQAPDLVINPGGPGGSGVQYARAAQAAYTPQLLAHDNIIGFDPRGIGSSDPLECLGTRKLDAFIASDPDPDNAAERRHMDQLVHGFGEACLRHDPALARNMSTEEVARDMDILRAALGQPKLDYFGASYGTLLGATYANLFPAHVGQMVLDGAIDPRLSNAQMSLAQAKGFQTALDSYVKSCVGQGGCVLGDSVPAAVRRVKRFLDATERHPLPTDDPHRPLTKGLAEIGVWMPLYVKSLWPQLTAGLTQAIRKHRGSILLSLADMYDSRGPSGYTDNSMNALYDVNCLDHDDYIPSSQVPAHFAQFEKASPTFGKTFAFSLSTCSTWPIKTHHRTHALHARGAPPILVLGTTRDPATPFAWAKALARQLDSGVLVSRNGDGHTAYNRGNACINDTVDSYLIDGTVPKNGKSC